MTGTSLSNRHEIVRLAIGALAGIALAFGLAVAPAWAASERALYLYYTHTKETARIVFKRNGQYVQSGLNELNQFLRDWRRNEPAKMDPRLFDLVWEVYQEVGATQPINVVSAYRSPATNAMLASKSSGVADNSQHMRGTAMDFFIPGVALPKLRAAAMRRQVGGVGYYPTSGSPFVHLDTGSVRAWPRMSRSQLADLFPDGRTMHLPADGKPLSQEGYQTAMAEWKRCHSVPCSDGSSGTRVASNGGGSGGTLMDLLFGGNDKQNAAPVPAAPQAAPQTASVQLASLSPQASTPRIAPVPAMRPARLGGADITTAEVAIPFSTKGSEPLDPSEMQERRVAPIPAMKSERMQIATAAPPPENSAVNALENLAAPQPRVQMSNPEAGTLTAYLPSNTPDAEAQRALQMIIERSTTGTVTPPQPAQRLPALSSGLRTASLGASAADPMANLFSGTFSAAQNAGDASVAQALASFVATAPAAKADMRRPELVAPDLEHGVDMLTVPQALTSNHFAVIFDHDEADFDPTPEMGPQVRQMGVGEDTTGLGHARFTLASAVRTN